MAGWKSVYIFSDEITESVLRCGGSVVQQSYFPSQHCFQVGTDSSRCVTCMVAHSQGVWLALQGSAQVRLYHAQTWDLLTEVDVAPAVHKMLAGKHQIKQGSRYFSMFSLLSNVLSSIIIFILRC